MKTGPYISWLEESGIAGEYGVRYDELLSAGDGCACCDGKLWFDGRGPAVSRGDGVRLLLYSGSVRGMRSGEVRFETTYGLLTERSLRARVLESRLAWSRCLFNSLCSGVSDARGGLDERERA